MSATPAEVPGQALRRRAVQSSGQVSGVVGGVERGVGELGGSDAVPADLTGLEAPGQLVVGAEDAARSR